jgi:hypothetical protein
MAQQPPSGSGLPHCRGFTITLRHTAISKTPLASDKLDAEVSIWQHTTLARDKYPTSLTAVD